MGRNILPLNVSVDIYKVYQRGNCFLFVLHPDLKVMILSYFSFLPQMLVVWCSSRKWHWPTEKLTDCVCLHVMVYMLYRIVIMHLIASETNDVFHTIKSIIIARSNSIILLTIQHDFGLGNYDFFFLSLLLCI